MVDQGTSAQHMHDMTTYKHGERAPRKKRSNGWPSQPGCIHSDSYARAAMWACAAAALMRAPRARIQVSTLELSWRPLSVDNAFPTSPGPAGEARNTPKFARTFSQPVPPFAPADGAAPSLPSRTIAKTRVFQNGFLPPAGPHRRKNPNILMSAPC